MKRFPIILSAAAATGLMLIAATPATAAPTVIELTQTPCQFLEPEGTDQGYTSTQKADCEKINAASGDERVSKSETITLDAGEYVFRVTNRNVPYGLGFWLRGDGLVNRARLPSVSGGGLATGTSKDYEITLKPGKYVFSCPLNTTPDYKLVVN